jgi:DNA-binding XRE family transcriptional regulator
MKARRRRIELKHALARELKHQEFSFYFERERAILEIARVVRDARLRAGLTQAEIAKRARTSQSAIARLESGADRRIPSLDLLDRIAGALQARLHVRFEQKRAA